MAHLKINNPSKGSVSAACRKQPVIRLRGLDRLPNNLELRPKVGLFFLKIKHPSKRTWFGFGFLYIYIPSSKEIDNYKGVVRYNHPLPLREAP